MNFSQWGSWKCFHWRSLLTGPLETTFSLTFFNKSLQLSLLNQLLDLSLQVVAIFCVVAVVSMKTAVLVSLPFIRVRQQLARPFQSWVVPYLHEDVIYRSVERSKVVEPLIKSPSTPILLSPVSVPLGFGPCLMGLRWMLGMIPFPLLSGGLILS